jgi:HD-GYP domain-containing protein (c-di-GMP phosphodiesterase class II)
VSRVAVPPSRLAELAIRAAQALNGLMLMHQGHGQHLQFHDLRELQQAIDGMADHLSPAVAADFDASGISAIGGYGYAHPANAAGLAMAIGVESGIAKTEVVALGMAAALMNVGYAVLRPSLLNQAADLEEENWIEMKTHAEKSCAMIEGSGLGDDVALAIAQHHERWDGSGYPRGLRRHEISLFARIVAIADTFASLRSPRPYRKAMGPRTATDFIMSGCGVLFDPEFVRVFARRIPHFPIGTTVELNTGETGVVVNPNTGLVCRPVVRVALARGIQVAVPYDIDLSRREHFTRVIVEPQETDADGIVHTR